MKAQTSYKAATPNPIVEFLTRRINRKLMLWLAGIIFIIATGVAFYQPVHPDPWHIHSGWDNFIYPQEKNAFLRQPSISQGINDVAVIGKQLWVVGDGGLILHSSDGGHCWVAQGPWVQSAGAASCPASKTGLQRIFSNQSADIQLDRFAEHLGFNAHAADAPAIDPKTLKQQALKYNSSQQESANPPQALQCGGLNQRPCTTRERSTACDDGLAEDSKTRRCIQPAISSRDLIPNLRAIAFFDDSSGIAVGDYGTILQTSNSGNSWQPVSDIPASTLYSIAIVDPNNSLIGGDNGLLLHSSNQGSDWQVLNSHTRFSIESFSAKTARFIYALAVDRLANQTTILFSGDRGNTWVADRSLRNLTTQDMVALDTEHLIVATSDGNILESTNSGYDWHRVHHENGVSIRSIARISDTRLIAVGSNGSILKSTDSAKSWNRLPSTSSAILTAVCVLDEQSLLAVGSSGSMLVSQNQGESWQSLTRGTRGELNSIASIDAQHLATVGRDGTLLYSSDGGNSWLPGDHLTDASLRSVTATQDSAYLAVGDQGSIVKFSANGRLGQTITSGVDNRLFSVASIGRNRYLAVGDRGTIITGDGNGNWKQVPSKVTTSLQAITSLDRDQLVIVGQQGTLLHSADASMNWDAPKFITDRWLLGVTALNNRSLVVGGYNGTILRSDDSGANWSLQSNTEPYRINALTSLSNQQMLAVGSSGTVLRSTDGGESWDTIPVATSNNLNAITRISNNRFFAVGSGGVILRSLNGGLNWQLVSDYSVSIANWWYLLLLLIMALVLFVVWPRVETTEDKGIAGLAASDRPLQPGDPDALNLSGIASDISSFLSNPKTTAPLTMAVTGPWGSGKSSLMNLVQANLKSRGFSPVWFNAWHHQKGEQLLASLFSHIRQQAIPSWFSFDGLWFRIKLAIIRGRRHWFIFAVMLALLFLTLSFNKQELTRLFLKLSLLSDPKYWWDVPWDDWIPNIQALFSDGDWIQTLASLFGIGTPLVALLKSIRGFATTPQRLLSIDHAGDAKSNYDPGARARFAAEFKDVTQALGNNKMVIFIDDLDRCSQANLIDILENINFIASSGDCFMLLGMAPKYIEACVANHYETLARSIAEKDKHESHNHSDDLETHKFRFAHNYLEKMINIEITIPQMQPNSIDQLLNPTNDNKTPWWQIFVNSWVQSLTRALNIIIPVTFILLAIGSGWEYGRKIPDAPKPDPIPLHDLGPVNNDTLIALATRQGGGSVDNKLEKSIQQTAKNPSAFNEPSYTVALQASQQQLLNGIKVGSIGEGKNQANLLLRLTPQAQKPTVVAQKSVQIPDADKAQTQDNGTAVAAEFRQRTFETSSRISSLWLAFIIMIFVSFAFYLYRKKTERYSKDSDDFKSALVNWTPWIQLKQETPRAVKRFLNHLRFLAIRNHQQMHESILVAMATIYFYNPNWLLDENSFNTICNHDVYPLLETDYRLPEQGSEQQNVIRPLLIELSGRLNQVLKQINIDDLCRHREQAIKILGGALPIKNETK